jgi:hypothetical protein
MLAIMVFSTHFADSLPVQTHARRLVVFLEQQKPQPSLSMTPLEWFMSRGVIYYAAVCMGVITMVIDVNSSLKSLCALLILAITILASCIRLEWTKKTFIFAFGWGIVAIWCSVWTIAGMHLGDSEILFIAAEVSIADFVSIYGTARP